MPRDIIDNYDQLLFALVAHVKLNNSFEAS